MTRNPPATDLRAACNRAARKSLPHCAGFAGAHYTTYGQQKLARPPIVRKTLSREPQAVCVWFAGLREPEIAPRKVPIMPPVDQSEAKRKSSVAAMERRRNLRFPFTATVEAVETKSGTKIVARTSDLSLGGCYIDTISPFPVGAEVTIRILRDNETFEAQSKVVYSKIGMGMGLAFTSAQPKQVRLFQRWLLEISGQGSPVPEPEPEEAAENAPAENTEAVMKSGVLSELIMTLMKKKVLTEVEGKELLRKLFT